jgi:hypothetical protein
LVSLFQFLATSIVGSTAATALASAAVSSSTAALTFDGFSGVAHVFDGIRRACGLTAFAAVATIFRMDHVGPHGVFFIDAIGAHFNTSTTFDALLVIDYGVPFF